MTTNKLSIRSTAYDSEYYYSKKSYSSAFGDYIYHDVSVSNSLILEKNGKTIGLDVGYQTGQGFCGNDYNCPSTDLSLYTTDLKSDQLLSLIDNLWESEFNEDDYIKEMLEDAHEQCELIETVEELRQLYDAFNDNCPGSILNFMPDGHSFDADDYTDNDEDMNECTLKEDEVNHGI